jgi:hypothetical protein
MNSLLNKIKLIEATELNVHPDTELRGLVRFPTIFRTLGKVLAVRY